MAFRHRLARLPRRPPLIMGGRSRDMEVIGDEVAVDTPGRPAADAPYRSFVPTGAVITPGGPMANQAPRASRRAAQGSTRAPDVAG